MIHNPNSLLLKPPFISFKWQLFQKKEINSFQLMEGNNKNNQIENNSVFNAINNSSRCRWYKSEVNSIAFEDEIDISDLPLIVWAYDDSRQFFWILKIDAFLCNIHKRNIVCDFKLKHVNLLSFFYFLILQMQFGQSLEVYSWS